MSWYNPFSWLGSSKVDVFDIVKNIQLADIGTIPGASRKDMAKEIAKIYGKNLENIISDIDGMFRPGSNFWHVGNVVPEGISTAKELIEKYCDAAVGRRGGVSLDYYFVSNKKWTQEDFKAIRYSCVFSERIPEIVSQHLSAVIATAAQTYARKAGDKSILSGKVPDECPHCDASYIDDWTDEDGDEMDQATITSDQSCSHCGFHLGVGLVKDEKKAYKLIRKFEEEKGVHIFPRVA